MPSSTSTPLSFADRLAACGCTDFIPLDGKLSKPSQLNYLDLLPKRADQKPVVTAVAEHQGTALLYIVDAESGAKCDPQSLAKIQRLLANRSDPAWLGVVRLGSLDIYPIGFHEAACTAPTSTIDLKSPTAPLFFQSLAHGAFKENSKLAGTDYVFHKIFGLLNHTIDTFVPTDGSGRLDALEVLSMAGRALFYRFLIDREIVRPDELHGPEGICPAATDLKDAFSTAEKAAQTSSWLDATFNGDFLPLIDESISADDRAGREAEYLRFYRHTERTAGKKIFTHLQAIMRGWQGRGEDFQPELDWGELDFAHIPVGVLSQVYESFSHRADPRTARDTSVHYTPRTIASLMVDEAFAAIKQPADAKVLDSSCGAGIFLVLAFRRLIRARWEKDERPNTKVIQEVLYRQIRGFDISESALRLAALALYITAIELNATPRPPKALKFPRNLRGEVLYRFGNSKASEKKPSAYPLGSLGPEVSPDFDKTFDLVLGNPPWTRLRDSKEQGEEDTDNLAAAKSGTDELNRTFTEIGRRVLTARGLGELAKGYQNPDKNPDLPFLWRAMEWAKEGGVIALAMPARIFGRTSGKGFEAWRAILRSVEVTGLINGADLRKTAVWESIDMPFCLLFARNEKPGAEHRFQYAAPIYDRSLNERGRFRIDYEAAQPISVPRVEKQPWILKTLSLGTWLDVEVMEQLGATSFQSLADVWSEWDRSGDKTGKGYDKSFTLKQKPADYLSNLPDFRPNEGQFAIQFEELTTYFDLYGKRTAHMPRREELYQPPLVIIPQSPGDDDEAPRAYLSDNPLAFSQSYYGYSCAGHPDAETLSALIYLLPHTTLFSYFCLMTSRRSGFDRQTFNKEEFDAMPFPEVGNLPKTAKSKIRRLANQLQNDIKQPWQELDEFIFELYGLDTDAVQVAKDTLFSAAAYRKAGKAALDRTTRDARAPFITCLRESLEPYFDVCGEHVAVREAEFQPDTWREPWFFLSVSRQAETVPINTNLIRSAMEVANQRGCSRIIVPAQRKRGILLGLLNQRRWWTATRGRLCAQHIIRERLNAFGLAEEI